MVPCIGGGTKLILTLRVGVPAAAGAPLGDSSARTSVRINPDVISPVRIAFPVMSSGNVTLHPVYCGEAAIV
jgi:hypothetical protein